VRVPEFAPHNFLHALGTSASLPRCAVRIVTFCPPALAIQQMSPDAPTSPPGGASGLNSFVFYKHLAFKLDREPGIRTGI